MANISTRLIVEEALSRGWKVAYLDEGYSSFVSIQPPHKAARLFKSTVTVGESAIGLKATDDKYITYLLLKKQGLPVPATHLITAKDDALAFLTAYPKCVVKPARADHGDGVSVNICDEESLERALQLAEAAHTSRALIQEQIEGSDHRFLVVGDAVFVSRRRPPYVTGDGLSTIRELSLALNDHPLRGDGHTAPLTKIDITEVERFLSPGRMDEVLPVGEIVPILGTANLSRGGVAEDLTDQAHQSLKDIARDASRLLNLSVCGVDIMCQDVTKPAGEQHCAIIEMNVSPGIRMHHFPSNSDGVNVAGAILDEVFKEE